MTHWFVGFSDALYWIDKMFRPEVFFFFFFGRGKLLTFQICNVMKYFKILKAKGFFLYSKGIFCFTLGLHTSYSLRAFWCHTLYDQHSSYCESRNDSKRQWSPFTWYMTALLAADNNSENYLVCMLTDKMLVCFLNIFVGLAVFMISINFFTFFHSKVLHFIYVYKCI